MSDNTNSNSRSFGASRPILVLLSVLAGLYMTGALIILLSTEVQAVTTQGASPARLLFGIVWFVYGTYCFYGLVDNLFLSGITAEPALPKRYSLPWSAIKAIIDTVLIAISMNIQAATVAAKFPWSVDTFGFIWTPAALVGWIGIVFIIARGFSLNVFEGWPFNDGSDEYDVRTKTSEDAE